MFDSLSDLAGVSVWVTEQLLDDGERPMAEPCEEMQGAASSIAAVCDCRRTHRAPGIRPDARQQGDLARLLSDQKHRVSLPRCFNGALFRAVSGRGLSRRGRCPA
jgi:hypothetical protein